MSSRSQNNSGGNETSNGSREISPIEVDLRTASDAPPRRSVQFSDKVQRFPESAPSSPKPIDASPTSKNVNKTPLDIASDSIKQDENVKKLEISNSDEQSKNGNKPQIDSFIDVKMEKQNNPDLKIEFNSPLSNSSTTFDHQQQQQISNKQNQQHEDIFKPTADAALSSSSLNNQPPHVKKNEDDKNFNGDFDDKPFVTTVILNVEMVRTPKETEPEDDWDTDTVKLAFSTNASNYEQKPNEQKMLMQENINQKQSEINESQSGIPATSEAATKEQTQENKPPRSPQFGDSTELKEGWNQIDLSPLLKTAPATDIASINAGLNRASSINEEELTEASKEQNKEMKAKSAEIPAKVEEQSALNSAEIPKAENDKLKTIEISDDNSTATKDSNQTKETQFGIMPHKIVEIPIQFHADKPVTPVDIPLSEFGIPSEHTHEIVIIFDNNSTDNKKDSTSSTENNASVQNGIVEIPIQFEGQPAVAKVDISLSQFGTSPLTISEIPIIFAGNDNLPSKTNDATKNSGITIIEIPIHFEGKEAPASLKDTNFLPASETSTEIQIIFENENDISQNVDGSTKSFGIAIPIQFEGQPAVAKVDVPLSQHGTPAVTTTEIPIVFADVKNGDTDSKEVKDEENTTEIAVIQFGFTAQKQDENATTSMKTESSNISEQKQDEASPTSSDKQDEKSDKSISDSHKYKIFEIPIQHEGQPEVQKVDIPLSECGTPAETREEIIIIFEKPEEKKSDTKENDNEDRFGLLHNKIIEIPIQMGDGAEVRKIDIPLSEFGFPAESIREIPIKMDENTEEESKGKQNENNKFGLLPFKVIKIPVQHEGKPAVEKVDIPLSEFGTPSESTVEIMIIFEDDKKDNEENEKAQIEDEQKKSTEADKNEPNEEALSNKKDQKQNVTEIPISIDSQFKQELTEQSKEEVPYKMQDTKDENKTNEIPISNENQKQQPTQISETASQQHGTVTNEEDTVTEIPITFETKNNQQTEQQQPQNVDGLTQEQEKASNEESRIIPITVEKAPEQQPETTFSKIQEKASHPSQSSEAEPASQLNQDKTAENKQDRTVPITFDKPNEQQQSQPASEENATDSTRNQQGQNFENSGDTIYQTTFAKPMVDENVGTQKQENAEKVPEANDVPFQNTFAQPLSTERKEEKPEEKSEQVNYQSNFAKPLNDDNQQKAKTTSQPEETNYWNQSSEQKNENQDQKQETVVPIKIEAQQPVSAPTQNETPKVEESRWESPKIDDKIESSLFSAPSPTTDDDFWIEVPASGVVHQIPISIQQTGAPSNSAQRQQSSTTPSTQNQQSSAVIDNTPKNETYSVQEKKSEPNFSSTEQPKLTKDGEITYYEVAQGGEQQQQKQQPSSGQDSFGNQANQDEKLNDSKPSNKSEEKLSNASQPLDSVRSPTKKYDDNSIELNIQEYEEQLRKNTQEALNLVDKLCESSTQQQQERQGKRDREREYERRSSQSPTNRDRSRSHSVQFNESQLEAQSYKVNPDLMQEPTAALLLPNFRLALADYQFGLSVFNLHTKDLKRIEGGNKWRRPHNMIYLPRAKQFLVLCEYSEKEDGNYQLFVCRFSSDLEYINRVEAPIFIRDKEILTFRMAYCHRTDCLYLAASTFNTGYIYELAPDGFWREVYTGRNKTFIDISIFAVIGPVTELMLVDTSRDYIVVVSIYNSEAADTRCVAACEKPSALTIDEKGTVIIYDRCSCKVGIHSRLDNLRVHDIALVDHPKCQLSSWDRLLAVLIPSKKDLRLYKY
uniref:Uncharacterized protein n=1 Tax=Panagrolaimus sp. PS1159 TaxID=55785 RepID=A0AC35FX82_9BILA